MKPESLMSCSENETQAAETRPLQHALRKSNVRFKCSNCQRRFPSILRLRRHLNLVHKGAGKLLWCSKCSLALSEVSDFIQHSRVHHQERKSGESQFFKVSQRQLPSIASQTLDFDSTEGKYKTVPVTREQNASAPENRRKGEIPIKDYSGNELTSSEYSALSNTTRMLTDVVTNEAITVTVTQSDTGSIQSENGDDNVTPPNESLITNAKARYDSASTRKRREASVGFDHDCSLLQEHPTMADIRMKTPTMSVSTRPNVIKRASKVVNKGRLAVCQTSVPPLYSQNVERNCSVSLTKDQLNINIPSNVQTVNLMSDARKADVQEKIERAEIVRYLRSVTAKLDAIIRHFNVPFSEIGTSMLTPPPSTSQLQHTQENSDIELENPPDAASASLMELLRKQSSSSTLDCLTGGAENSSMFQRSIDNSISSVTEGDAIQQKSSFIVDDAVNDITKVEQPRFDFDFIRLPEDLVQDLHSKSLNRGNFAKHLVFHLFSPEERKGRNCFGRRAGLQSGPKAPLDPVRLQYVRDKVFQYYPCEPGLEETVWRRQCVIAVDTALRGENRPHKKVM